MIRCNICSILVHDQQVAEDFYVGKLGFKKRHDVRVGGARWLTVIAQDDSGAEILLEPSGHDFSKAWQKELFDRGMPLTSLASTDVRAEYDRLTKLGVAFRGPPAKHGDYPLTAVFEDGCGNLIMLVEG
jgi:catechol 2,3-dioxygenase-like lactoylglutathione lyase family enzyme